MRKASICLVSVFCLAVDELIDERGFAHIGFTGKNDLRQVRLFELIRAAGGSFTQWSVTSFGFGRNFAGFGKRLCAYSKKSLWCGARRDGWSRPLPLGAPRPMIFK